LYGGRALVDALLKKDQSERLSMTAMINDPIFANKVVLFANSGYRPKALEERHRRAHVKQLQGKAYFHICVHM
jgi:hypothetical protein